MLGSVTGHERLKVHWARTFSASALAMDCDGAFASCPRGLKALPFLLPLPGWNPYRQQLGIKRIVRSRRQNLLLVQNSVLYISRQHRRQETVQKRAARIRSVRADKFTIGCDSHPSVDPFVPGGDSLAPVFQEPRSPPSISTRVPFQCTMHSIRSPGRPMTPVCISSGSSKEATVAKLGSSCCSRILSISRSWPLR
jgi:hypothetical protein